MKVFEGFTNIFKSDDYDDDDYLNEEDYIADEDDDDYEAKKRDSRSSKETKEKKSSFPNHLFAYAVHAEPCGLGRDSADRRYADAGGSCSEYTGCANFASQQ